MMALQFGDYCILDVAVKNVPSFNIWLLFLNPILPNSSFCLLIYKACDTFCDLSFCTSGLNNVIKSFDV